MPLALPPAVVAALPALGVPPFDTGCGGLAGVLVGPHAIDGCGDGSGMAGSSVRALVKSSASARLRALASRAVIGGRPHRHSIIFRIDVCSNGAPPETTRFCANGDAITHGTRKPSCR